MWCRQPRCRQTNQQPLEQPIPCGVVNQDAINQESPIGTTQNMWCDVVNQVVVKQPPTTGTPLPWGVVNHVINHYSSMNTRGSKSGITYEVETPVRKTCLTSVVITHGNQTHTPPHHTCTPAIPAHLHTCTPAHMHTCTPAHLHTCTYTYTYSLFHFQVNNHTFNPRPLPWCQHTSLQVHVFLHIQCTKPLRGLSATIIFTYTKQNKMLCEG